MGKITCQEILTGKYHSHRRDAHMVNEIGTSTVAVREHPLGTKKTESLFVLLLRQMDISTSPSSYFKAVEETSKG